jgi:uncharacterized protein with NRDE domain
MCLLLIAWKVHPRYELLVAANRDEHHARPTAPLDYWPDAPGVVAGRDLVAAGTWLATLPDGRFATVTNFRDEAPPAVGPRSRGELVMRFFDSGLAPDAFAAALAADHAQYAGFNLVVGDQEQLIYASNRTRQFSQPLAPGLHGLSNHQLGTPWPKVRQGLQALRSHVDTGHDSVEPLFDALLEQQLDLTINEAAPAGTLPWPASSGPFISQEQFGTRATTLLWRDNANHICIEERRFAPRGVPTGRSRITLGATQ